MSKRYGRQQKRKARQQIAELQGKLALAERRRDESIALGRRNAWIVAETAKVLGRYFITLPPESEIIQHLDTQDIGYRMAAEVVPHSYVAFGHANHAINSARFVTQVLPIIHSDSCLSDIQGLVHLRVKYDGHHVGTVIKREVFQLYSKEEITDMVARELAGILAREIKAAKR